VVSERLNGARERKRRDNRTAWLAEEAQRIAAGRSPRTEPTWPLPRLNATEKSAVAARVRSYTLLDYLYRLRIKTNYEDAGMFIEGPEEETSSRRVHRDLVAISACTLLVHELHIGAIIGRNELLRWVDDWLGPHAHGQTLGLVLRRDLLAQHVP
jgi:hypothetical protein